LPAITREEETAMARNQGQPKKNQRDQQQKTSNKKSSQS
jgi:hypothetical protein